MHKSVFLTLFLIAFSTIAYSQVSAGLGLHYGTESEIGFSIRGGYDILDNIRANATFNFLQKEDVNVLGVNAESSWRSLDLEGNYFFGGEIDGVYGLAGLTFSFIKGSVSGIVDVSDTQTKVGLNIGGGYLYSIEDNIQLFGEIKYALISDVNQLAIQAGAVYLF